MLMINGCDVCEVDLDIEDVFVIAKILRGNTIGYRLGDCVIASIRIY